MSEGMTSEKSLNETEGDYFSAQAASYAKVRPTYPRKLFEHLASVVPTHNLAWDAGCGTGQSSVALTEFFGEVYATDVSQGQIANANPHPRVRYELCPSERTQLPTSSLDLITVSAAIHWFDLPRFFAEAMRVLRLGGVIAAWGYSVPTAPAIDELVATDYWPLLDPYWPASLKALFERYGSLKQFYHTFSWPFEELAAPSLEMTTLMGREAFLSYLGTWSAAEEYRNTVGRDPLAELRTSIADAWPAETSQLELHSQIYLRIARK